MEDTVKNKYIRRYRNKSLNKVFRMSRWAVMALDWTAERYSISKAELLRAMILSVQKHEEIEAPIEFPVKSLNESALINIYIDQLDYSFLEESAKHLKLSLGKLLECIILTSLDQEIERLKGNHPRTKTLNSRKRRQYYFSEELSDALCMIRDELGKSISELLTESIVNNRISELTPLPIVRKERKFTLTLSKQEWEQVDILATGSGIDADEAAAILLINHFFENQDAKKQSRRSQ